MLIVKTTSGKMNLPTPRNKRKKKGRKTKERKNRSWRKVKQSFMFKNLTLPLDSQEIKKKMWLDFFLQCIIF